MAAGDVDCDTELCLAPGGRSSTSRQKKTSEMSVSGGSAGGGGELMKKISVFYGGQVCICDVTEIQARAIICMAKRGEMEEMMKISGQPASALGGSCSEQPTVSDKQLLNSRLSMKRSLQSFLQQRKSRACESASPYLVQEQQKLYSDSSSSS